MAVIPAVQTSFPEPGNPTAWAITWGPMQNGDVGAPVYDIWNYADRSIQVEGTFGAGGAVAGEGSNDGANFRTLSTPQGSSLLITQPSINAVVELSRMFRPHVTAGDGTTSLTVTCFFRRSTPRL